MAKEGEGKGKWRSPVLASSCNSSSSRRKSQWEVSYARFFPVLDGPAPAPLTRSSRVKDAWLACRSATSLALFLMSESGESGKKRFGVTVKLGDDLIEEHLMENLIFSWPQVSCVPQCPIRGSRVVFMSFKDQSRKIQKFAVRFSESSVAEEFLNSVKECSMEMNGKTPAPESVKECAKEKTVENPSPQESELSVVSVVPFKFHYKRKRSRRTNSVTSSEQLPIAICKAEGVPQRLDYTNYYSNIPFEVNNNNNYSNEDGNNALIEPLMAVDELDSLLGLPPSFTDLLTNCSSSIGPGHLVPTGGAYDCYQNAVPIPAPESRIGGSDQDADLMAQIMKYMNDDSFQATVCKIEKLVGEMGGDWIF